MLRTACVAVAFHSSKMVAKYDGLGVLKGLLRVLLSPWISSKLWYVNDVVGRIRLDGGVLGSGGFGTCVSASRLRPGSDTPENIVLKLQSSKADNSVFDEELRILDHLHSQPDAPGAQRIVKPIGAFKNAWIGRGIAFERLGKDLDAIARETPRFSLTNIRDITRDILEALEHCHSRGIVHSDIKPANIVISNPDTLSRDSSTRMLINPRVKLIDFGIACKVTEERWGLDGTSAFMSPEIILLNSRGVQSDMWSLAVTIYLLRSKKSLFERLRCHRGSQLLMMEMVTGEEIPQDMMRIAKEDSRRCEYVVQGSDGQFKVTERILGKALRRMEGLPPNARDLITADTAQHEVTRAKSLADLLVKMMHIDPNKRVSAKVALKSQLFKTEKSVVDVTPVVPQASAS